MIIFGGYVQSLGKYSNSLYGFYFKSNEWKLLAGDNEN